MSSKPKPLAKNCARLVNNSLKVELSDVIASEDGLVVVARENLPKSLLFKVNIKNSLSKFRY